MQIQYCIQYSPDGLAQGLVLAQDFIGQDDIALILGDNIFYGQGFSPMLQEARENTLKGFSPMLQEARENTLKGYATIFSYRVNDPWRFGVVEIDKQGQVISLEEKPQKPKSNFAATGLYFYDNNAIEIAKQLKPSPRGELEITDVNIAYLKANKLKSQILGRGFAWLDTGTHDSLIDASTFVQTIELRQGYKIACLEEIAFHNKWIDENKLLKRIAILKKSGYGAYLEQILESQK